MLSATIIICTKDREKDLKRCLDSIVGQTRTPDELVVVDSGTDAAERHVREFEAKVPRCTVQYLRSGPGLTKQRNIGIAAATREILHFFDDDIVCDPDYVEEIQQVFESPEGEHVLSAGPKVRLNYAPSRLGGWFRKLFLLVDVRGTGRMLRSGFGSYTWYTGVETIHPLEVLCGCCCAFRRSVFDRIAFDEFFTGYGYMEDLEFSYRASRLGRMVGNPKAQVLHLESQSARTQMRRLVAMQIVNHHYVFKKLLPQDARHWLCFWWSELGEAARRLILMVRTLNVDVPIGMAQGYCAILRGKAGPAR